MTAIVTIVAATLLALFAIMAATSWFMHRLMQAYIGSKHQLLEEIIRTEKVPESWSHRSYMNKLDRLAAYVRKTRLVEDEETRQTLLADLERIRMQWRENRCNEQLT